MLIKSELRATRMRCSHHAIGLIALSLMLLCAGWLQAQAPSEDSGIILTRGKIAVRRGDFASAQALFEQAVQQNSNSAEACFWLGITYLRLGQTAKAELQLQRAV